MKLTDFITDIGRPVAYYPGLKKITGSTTATILLCQLLYWSTKTDREIYKTSEQLEEETGLTYEEQKTARKKLVERGLIQETYARLDHAVAFLVDRKQIDALWEASRQSLDGGGIMAIPRSRTGQSLVGEQGNPSLANKANPRSLNELKSTVETTIENTNEEIDVEKILGQKRPIIKPTEKLSKEERLERIQIALETGQKNYIRDISVGQFDCNHFPADVQETIRLFTNLWQIEPPKQKDPGYADWVKSGRELIKTCGEFGYELIKQIHSDWKKNKSYMVSRPGSLINVARSLAGVIRQKTDTRILGEVNRDERYSWDSTLTEEENLRKIEKLTGEKLTR